MRRKAVSGIMLTLLLIGMSTLTSNMQPVKPVKASPLIIQNAHVNIHNTLRGVGPSGESPVGYGFELFIHTLEDPGEVSPEEVLLEVIAEGATHTLSIAEVEILGWTNGLFCIKARGHFEEDDPTIEPILGEYQVSVKGTEPFHICELGDIPKDAPEVLYPEHGQSIVDTTPVFEWEAFLSDYLGGLVFPLAYEINIIFPDGTWLTAFPINDDQTSLDYLTADWDSEAPPELSYGLYSLIIHSNHWITDGLAFQHHRIIDFYVAPACMLTVTSSPITGITFTIDGNPKTTPYTEWLLEGSYTLVMPETHDGYVWLHWLEDGDTNRIKAITLPGTTWTGVYEQAPPPPTCVGGEMVLISNTELTSSPWTSPLIAFVSMINLATAILVVYVKHRKKQQP